MTTKYVSTTGSDGGTGDTGDRWATLTFAIGSAQGLGAGDTIIVEDGTYDENITWPLGGAKGTDFGSNVLTIKAETSQAVIRPTGTGNRCLTISGAFEYIEFQNFKFDLSAATKTASNDCVKVTGGAHHIKWTTCEATGAGGGTPSPSATGHGWLISGGAHGCEWHGGKAFNNGTEASYDHGIYISGTNTDCLIDGVEFYGNASSAIHLFGMGSSDIRATIRNCNMHANGGEVVILFGTDGKFYNNRMWNESDNGFGVALKAQAHDWLVVNNSFTDVSRAVKAFSGSTGCIVQDNLGFECVGDPIFEDLGSNTFSDNLTADPGWTDKSTGDMSLTLITSIAVDVGTDRSAIFTTDILGNSRIGPLSGSGFDAGAYEFQGTATGGGLDSRQKRQAALAMPWTGILPEVDGSVAADDRAVACWTYPLNLGTEGSAMGGSYKFLLLLGVG
jgi:hypothetical protein